MKVGIVLNYIRHDSTYAALKTAEILRDKGYVVTLFDKSHKSVKARLHAYWDDFILSTKEIPFDDWTDDCDVVIWYTYPSSKEVRALKKYKVPNICVVTWDSVDSDTISCIKGCSRLVCPSASQTSYFREYWRLKNVTCIPLDCNCPLTLNGRKPSEEFSLIVACPGYQIKRIDHSKLFESLYLAMEKNPKLNIDFLFSNKVASQIKININKFEKTFPEGNKLVCVDDPTGWSEGPLLYSLYDAVLWPVQLESFGYVALEALSMGTPVIAYNFPPMSEIVSDHVNGFIIPCDRKETELGVSYAVHNGDELLKTLGKVISDKELVQKVKSNTHKGLEERAEKSSALWDQIIDEAMAEIEK
jgi:glycosyltransferase involved in cell wall biosynthesis